MPVSSEFKFEVEGLKRVIFFFFLWSATAKWVSAQTSWALCWASKASGIFLLFNSQSFGRWDKAMLSTKFILNVLVLQEITWHLLCFSCEREVVINYNSDFFSKRFNWGISHGPNSNLVCICVPARKTEEKYQTIATTEVWGPLSQAAPSANRQKEQFMCCLSCS